MNAIARKRFDSAIPVRSNLRLTLGFLAAGLGLLLLVPLGLSSAPLWGLLLLPFVVATPTFWALIHEAIHGSLHPDHRWNHALGRALAILFGAPFDALRFGHLTHHRLYGAAAERLGSQPRPVPQALAAPFHYGRILGGVYLVEIATVVIVFLPRTFLLWIVHQALRRHPAGAMDNRERIEARLLSSEGLGRMRFDSLIILTLYGVAFALYGAHGWMLAAALAGRAALVSFMDNVYHHRPAGAPRRTLDLRLPRWASAAILHANLHAVHHRQPGLPWSELPKAKRDHSGDQEAGFVAIALEQLRNPCL